MVCDPWSERLTDTAFGEKLYHSATPCSGGPMWPAPRHLSCVTPLSHALVLFPLPSTRLSHTWLMFLCFFIPPCLWQPSPRLQLPAPSLASWQVLCLRALPRVSLTHQSLGISHIGLPCPRTASCLPLVLTGSLDTEPVRNIAGTSQWSKQQD